MHKTAGHYVIARILFGDTMKSAMQLTHPPHANGAKRSWKIHTKASKTWAPIRYNQSHHTNETLDGDLSSLQALIKSSLIDGCKLLPIVDVSTKVSAECFAGSPERIKLLVVHNCDGNIWYISSFPDESSSKHTVTVRYVRPDG
jgi:hypothetical protein